MEYMFVSKQKIITVVCTSVLFLSACTKKTVVEQPKRLNDHQVQIDAEKPDGIELKAIERKPFPVTLDLPGRVAIPDKDFYMLAARVAGRIDSMPINIGDRVHVGSLVAVFWSPDLATAADEYEIAKAQKNAELVALSEQKLRSIGITPGDAVSGRIAFPLRSPMEGVVLDKKATVGASLNPGDQILTIGKSGSFQFQGDVPPTESLQMKPGMKVTFDDAPTLKASIDTVSSIADPTSRLVRIRCKFEDSRQVSLAQETFLKAKVVLKEKESLVTSVKAVVVDENAQYVFIQNPANPKIFDRTKVKVLSTSAGEIAFEPLDDKLNLDLTKARIVTDGALLLNGILEDSE
jgi:multidrug efflux pump subunit AcrA (membrane-fusion protein)